MILTLDVGNSHIYGGLFDTNGKLHVQFRKNSIIRHSSDELGLFLRGVLRENGQAPEAVSRVAVCSVVPALDHSLRNCIRKYFSGRAFFLQPGTKTGLKIHYRNPVEVGADRIANAIAGIELYPNQNLIIADLGTATTVDAISRDKEFLGGAILAGMGISAEVLESRTARLPSVEILKPPAVIGRSTVENIQSGLYYGHLGMLRELIRQMTQEAFHGEQATVIGTGGFSRLFQGAGVFDREIPDLVLQGLWMALKQN